jgi:hypothetical protein
MRTLAAVCLLSALALPAAAETAADLLGPAQPLQTEGSFSGAMMDNDSEVLTPVGIMDEDMFTAIQPAAGPIEATDPSTTEVSPTDTTTSPTTITPPPTQTSPTTP